MGWSKISLGFQEYVAATVIGHKSTSRDGIGKKLKEKRITFAWSDLAGRLDHVVTARLSHCAIVV